MALLAAAAADRASAEAAIPGAIAVEALHNCAFLLDDVMDGDRYRRQRETAWVVFGKGMLADQAIDLQMEGASEVTVERCLQMTDWKTVSLMHCGATMGAVLAGASARVLSGLRTYGECLGVAFQARDDLLGIWGEPDRTGGRPPGFDLRARKATLPVACALHEGGETADELRELPARPEPGDDDVARATKLVEQGGGRDRTASWRRPRWTTRWRPCGRWTSPATSPAGSWR
ncbi:polyprenyl synthetase family protein [Streptomyces sp. NPDC017529]|uniref:polyprenyl synthetase family protein n=1 Tax=Streptomyces sp. NPDC017529 TaxID=3365000 RepID=UPI0037887D73